VADKTDNDPKEAPSATPRFDPKPVQVGGESLVDRLLPHMKQIVWGLVGIAVVLSIVFTVRHFQDRKREGETEKLAAVLDVADKPIAQPGEAPDPKAKEPPFADAKARAAAVLDAMAKQGTDAAGPTYRGAMLVQAGKLDEAITEYRKGQGQTGLDGVLAREGLGLALEMKAEQDKDAAARQKGLEEALATFKTMQPDDKGPRGAYALYHQGRVLALLGKRVEARAALEKVKELAKEGELPQLVDERLAGLGAS
jgi:predicted negative regulator of RcsB-dependent stress response